MSAPLFMSAVCLVPFRMRSARDCAEPSPLTKHTSLKWEEVILGLRS